MKIKKKLLMFVCAAVCLTMSLFIYKAQAKEQKQHEVVVYTSLDQVFSEPILKAFEEKTGIKVKVVFLEDSPDHGWGGIQSIRYVEMLLKSGYHSRPNIPQVVPKRRSY